MNGNGDHLDFRQWRNIASYLAGIGVETLFSLALAGVAGTGCLFCALLSLPTLDLAGAETVADPVQSQRQALTLKESKLKDLEQGYRPQEITEARAQAEQARANRTNLEEEARRSEALFQGGATSQQRRDKDRTAAAVAHRAGEQPLVAARNHVDLDATPARQAVPQTLYFVLDLDQLRLGQLVRHVEQDYEYFCWSLLDRTKGLLVDLNLQRLTFPVQTAQEGN